MKNVWQPRLVDAAMAGTGPRAPLWIVAGVVSLVGCSPQEVAPPVPLPVYVTEVHNARAGTSRTFSAVVRPRVESELAFRIGGRIAERRVDVGQVVRAGQVLARLDPADAVLATASAEAQVRAAEIEAVQSASDAARFARLLADGSVGAADQERQQARADAASARLVLATRQLDLTRNRAGYASLTAPFDGVVTALRMETGQQVAEGKTVATVARPSELEVQVDVPEELAAHLGDYTATASLPGRHDQSVGLQLRELSPSAADSTRTFRAKYSVAQGSRETRLRMGETAQLRLTGKNGVATADLPVGALIATGGQPFVWKVDERSGALSRLQVQLVSHAADRVQVTGLADDVLVVSVGAQKLDPKLKVQAVLRPLDAIARAEGR